MANDSTFRAAFAKLQPPVLAKAPSARGLAAKSVSFAEGTRGGPGAVPSGSALPAMRAVDFLEIEHQKVAMQPPQLLIG